MSLRGLSRRAQGWSGAVAKADLRKWALWKSVERGEGGVEGGAAVAVLGRPARVEAAAGVCAQRVP